MAEDQKKKRRTVSAFDKKQDKYITVPAVPSMVERLEESLVLKTTTSHGFVNTLDDKRKRLMEMLKKKKVTDFDFAYPQDPDYFDY